MPCVVARRYGAAGEADRPVACPALLGATTCLVQVTPSAELYTAACVPCASLQAQTRPPEDSTQPSIALAGVDAELAPHGDPDNCCHVPAVCDPEKSCPSGPTSHPVPDCKTMVGIVTTWGPGPLIVRAPAVPPLPLSVTADQSFLPAGDRSSSKPVHRLPKRVMPGVDVAAEHVANTANTCVPDVSRSMTCWPPVLTLDQVLPKSCVAQSSGP